jgi:anti-anti-sigma factor
VKGDAMTSTDPHRLPAELSIYTVAELHPQWLKWLASATHNEHCTVDASAVEQADAAGVQLLLSLATALHQQGRPLRLVAPSAPLRDACAALGLADWAEALAVQEQPA